MKEVDNEQRFIGRQEEYKFVVNGTEQNLASILEQNQQRKMTEGMQKYMPIGSVVSLDGSDEYIMIVGFKPAEGMYDYCGCAYPFGLSKQNALKCFNHDQIKKVFHIGFINSMERDFKSSLDLSNSSGKTLG